MGDSNFPKNKQPLPANLYASFVIKITHLKWGFLALSWGGGGLQKYSVNFQMRGSLQESFNTALCPRGRCCSPTCLLFKIQTLSPEIGVTDGGQKESFHLHVHPSRSMGQQCSSLSLSNLVSKYPIRL